MRSTVIIEKRGSGYICTVSGKFGGGYQMARAGLDPQAAAAFAAREMIRYAQSNSEGGDLLAPPEVLDLVPLHLHSEAIRDERDPPVESRNKVERGTRGPI
jgi:hypothetical protein